MLTERLNCIINYVNCETAADIGTDHGYVPTELIKTSRAKRVIAADVRQGPLNAAIENIKKNCMEDKIEARLGSGLSVLKPNEADICIIAGMGGEMICDIISAHMETARSMTLILQPMNAQYELRKFLVENGFIIEKEDLAAEGERLYNIMIVKKGKKTPFNRDIYYHIPTYLTNHPLFEMLFNKKKLEFNKIVNGLRKSKNCDSIKLAYYEDMLLELKRGEYKNG